MEPTLVYGDRILVTKWRPDPLPLRRGDIIVFKDPGELARRDEPEDATRPHRIGKEILTFTGLLPEDAGEHLVKRIIGLPGDHVECDDPDGKVKVNGVEITEDYIAPGARPCGKTFSVDVPEGHLWVMGDNRDNSADSRAHMGQPGGGTIPRDHVVGAGVRARVAVRSLHRPRQPLGRRRGLRGRPRHPVAYAGSLALVVTVSLAFERSLWDAGARSSRASTRWAAERSRARVA